MLNIVTGKINSSKTNTILDIYKSLKKGDGFISIKNMNNNIVHSYDILHLATSEKKLLVIRDIYSEKDFVKCCQIGPYMFSESTVKDVEIKIRELIKQNVSPLFLDEIGLLELDDNCFHDIFLEMLMSKLEIYVTVRTELLDKILKKYKIDEYNLIQTN